MCACVYGRLDNVKFWLERNSFKDWNLETRGILGNVAMGNAVYMGPDRFELVKYLLKYGAKFDSVTDNGTSNLMSACANEDADPRVVKLFLENVTQKTMNRKIRAKTNMWRLIYMFANVSIRTGVNKTSLMQSLAERQGRTALHYAARRGDLEIVELMLEHGADPSMRDDRGMSVIESQVSRS